ncbi:MAG: ribonuclease P protein component [Gemmatimonadetes bacterium]|nr:ribonuclease P protein component [Gemmatimonadota bacterium]
MTSEGLPRSWRITRGEDLKAVLSAATRCSTPRLEIAWRANQTEHPRLGVIVPRFGQTAVARNRLRRRIRELARRRILPVLPPVDLVIRSRSAAYSATHDALAADIDQWLETLPL